MDLLPAMIVGVRRDVRSIVYRSALQRHNYGNYGFLLGTTEDFTRPVFEIALVAKETKLGDLYHDASVLLERKLAAATHAAGFSQTSVVGLFMAWSALDRDFKYCHEQFGILIDSALRLGLAYVAEFPTLGHESIWGLNIYFAGRFPHDRLRYKMLPRRSQKSIHNPRRVLKLWKSLNQEAKV